MNKGAFLYRLKERLSGFPQDDIEERLIYYGEIIDNRMAEGMSEESAVASLGSVEEISSHVISEIPLNRFVMRRMGQGDGVSSGRIWLAVLTFPIWLPLMITAFALVIAVYVTLWALLISIYCVVLAVAVVAVVSVPAAILLMLSGKVAGAVFALGAGMMMGGLTLIIFVISRGLGRGIIGITRGFANWVKSLFVKKGGDEHAFEH